MGSYLQGIVEKKPEHFDEWQFVARVDSIVGTQGEFRDLIFGAGNFRFLEPLPHKKGVPEDLSRDAKINIEGVSTENPDESLEEYVEDLQKNSSYNRVMYISLESVREFDWDSSISDENLEEMRDSENVGWNNFRIFKLVDENGQEYSHWGEGSKWYYDSELEEEQVHTLVEGEKVELGGSITHLERRSRREFIPESWFKLLELMDFFAERSEDVRFFFIHGY